MKMNSFLQLFVVAIFLLTASSALALIPYNHDAILISSSSPPADVVFPFTFASITTGNLYQLYNGVLSSPNGAETIYLSTANELGALNSYIQNNSSTTLSLTLSGYGANPNIPMLNITDHSVAPEPASIALVAAGLVGLPFARRLKKSFQVKS